MLSSAEWLLAVWFGQLYSWAAGAPVFVQVAIGIVLSAIGLALLYAAVAFVALLISFSSGKD